MAQIREIEAAKQALSSLESHIRAMPVPTQDRIWSRIRQEQVLLTQLLNFDLIVVRSSEQIYQYVAQLTPESWISRGNSELRQLTQQLIHLAQERERFLLLPL
jgi:nitric oxide reductase activation protein